MLVGAELVLGDFVVDMRDFGEFTEFLIGAIGFFTGLLGEFLTRDQQFSKYCIKNKLLPMPID